jgi:Tetratricopeptide repeat
VGSGGLPTPPSAPLRGGDFMIASLDRSIEIQPDYHEYWHNRGVALANLGRYEDATL